MGECCFYILCSPKPATSCQKSNKRVVLVVAIEYYFCYIRTPATADVACLGVSGAVLGPGQGGPGPPVVVQAPPSVFLGTNYDAVSAFVVDDVLRRSCLMIWSHSTISLLFVLSTDE